MDRFQGLTLRAWLIVVLACCSLFACGTASAEGSVPRQTEQATCYRSGWTTRSDGVPYPSASPSCIRTRAEQTEADARVWGDGPDTPTREYWFGQILSCSWPMPPPAVGNYSCSFEFFSKDPRQADNPTSRFTQSVPSIPFVETRSVCPDSSFEVPGGCQCNGGYKPDAGGTVCVVDPDAPADCGDVGKNLGGDGSSKYTMGTGTTACYRGCVAVPQWQYGQGENRWGTGPWTSMGVSCSGDGGDGKPQTPEVDEPATSCGSGKCPGQVNGVDVCVPCGTTTSTEVTGTKGKDANGNDVDGPTTTTTATDNGDGSVTVTTTVQNPDGSTTTTTTTRPKNGVDADGQTGGSGDGDDGEDPVPFCTENPDSPICKVGSFGGSCSGSFTCQGDAVQCAMAREQHERNCQLYDKPNSLTAYAETITDALQGPEHPASSPRQVNVAGTLTVDRTDLGCPVNTEITLMGKTVVIPWVDLCNGLRFMGDIAFALSLISAIIFLMRKVGG